MIIAVLLFLWCIYRMRKYPLAGMLRILSPLLLPSFALSKPFLHLSNSFLTHLPFPKLPDGLSVENGIASGVPFVLFRPEGKDDLPLLFYLHGGGFFFEASPGLFRICARYAAEAGCAVMVPRYRTSDRYPYPAQEEDAVKAFLYAAGNMGFTSIAVGGDSAGGCLAASLAIWARDNGFSLKFQMLVYPVLDRRLSTESMKTFRDSPIWNAKLSEKMWSILDADTSPSECDDLSSLPRTYIEVEEYDSLRDEGSEYAERLNAAGVPVDYHFVKGSCHGFDQLFRNSLSDKMIGKRVKFIKENII